jgi:enoyl-[acyl-carrier protein] reductase III
MEQKPKGWDWTMDINAKSFLFASQLAVPLMEKRSGGKIISITSPGAERVLPEYVVVGASKAALNALTRYLAVELAPKNIVVNGISPGVVATDVMKHFSAFQDENLLEKISVNTPVGRLTQPEDIAKVAAFLCSPDAEMICGQIINVDGGIALPLKTVGE